MIFCVKGFRVLQVVVGVMDSQRLMLRKILGCYLEYCNQVGYSGWNSSRIGGKKQSEWWNGLAIILIVNQYKSLYMYI